MPKQESTTQFPTRWLVITSIIAGLLLIVVNSAIWMNRQVFDSTAFTNTAVSSLTSESSRNAIGSRITDEALKNNPIAKSIVGDRVSNLISGMLGTDLADKLLNATVSRLQIYVTSNNQQDVDIDLTGIKSILSRVAEASANDDTTKINPENIPDKIVLIEADNVPDLYNYGVALNWVAPLGFLISLGLLATPYFVGRQFYTTIMMIQGGVLVLVGLISLLIGPVLRPMALEPFPNPNGRIVVGNLYDAFIGTFNSQTLTFIYLGILVFIIGFGIRIYPKVIVALRSKA